MALDEFLVGVDAAQLQDGVAHRRLDKHGKVSARIDGDDSLSNGHIQNALVQRLVGQPLEFALQRFLANQVHDQLDAHLPAHGGFSEDRLDVEQADAAHFEQVEQQFRAASLECRLRHAVDVHCIVGNQSVTSGNQLQAQLTFAQARFAREQNTQPENVHEHPVARGSLGEQLAEVAADHVDHLASRLGGDKQRDGRALAHRHQAVRWRLAIGHDHHRWLQRHDALDAALLILRQ